MKGGMPKPPATGSAKSRARSASTSASRRSVGASGSSPARRAKRIHG